MNNQISLKVMAQIRAHVFVNGNVQGVFFRQTTKQQADNKGVTGWIRNLRDERVEAIFEGTEETVKEIVDFCRKGPKGAIVTNISVDWEPFKGEFKDFQIVYGG